LTQA